MELQPVTLEGQFVRLEPLSLTHVPALTKVGTDPELWRWTKDLIRNEDEMRAYVSTAVSWRTAGTALPFATLEKESGRAVGCTRMFDIDRDNRTLEIGYTWVAPPWQRSVINTEAKYLMLRHAFETLRCIRVQLKTDSLNEKSRAAILRIGAKLEGIFHNHLIMREGRYRHTAFYAILEAEWPAIKQGLEDRLDQTVDGYPRD